MPRITSETRTASGTRGAAEYTATTGSTDAFLLLEIGDDILLEIGDRIILDGISGSGGSVTTYRQAISTARSAVT